MQYDPIEVAITSAWTSVTLPASVNGRYFCARTAGQNDWDITKTEATSYPVFGSEEFQDNNPGTYYEAGDVIFKAKLQAAGSDTLHVVISD